MQQQKWDDAKCYCQKHLEWVYVAIEDNKVVGFCTLEYWPEKHAGRIQNNAVLLEYRGRGISTKLAKQTIRELENLGAKYITVHTTHVPAARRVYEKVGFKLNRQEGEDYYYEMHI